MSIFNSASIPCPVCETIRSFALVASVNGDRRPDLRAAILAETFQVETCDACGSAFRPPPRLSYIDVGRGEWIMVAPTDHLEEWADFEAMARATFEKAYGKSAPLAAQSIGSGLRARTTFGWAGLREKLQCDEHGLDDIDLELLKLAVLRTVPGPPVDEKMELRLIDFRGEQLVLAWLDSDDDRQIATIEVPRSAYDAIAADYDSWQPLREQFSGKLYVDFNRTLV